ncbi:MAG: AAA family ATPase, partial [Dietzia cercidiphylli]
MTRRLDITGMLTDPATRVVVCTGAGGVGKTTTAAKLALFYKGKGRRPLLVAADTQRPAAREQLRILGER